MTYSSKDGPEGGAPAIMTAAMLGDCAAAIFSPPEEIGKFIDSKC
jgi:cytochrome c